MVRAGAQYAPENEWIIPLGRILAGPVPGYVDLFHMCGDPCPMLSGRGILATIMITTWNGVGTRLSLGL